MRELFDLIDRHWELLDALMVAVGLVVYVAASQSLHQRRHPSAAIAWVIGIMAVPYVVLPLYLVFGTRKIPVSDAGGSKTRPALPVPATNATAARALQLGRAMGLPDPVPYEKLTLHEDGAQALGALRKIIDDAELSLEVSTFLLGRDILGDEIAERLKRRAREGVRVRLLIDGIGIYMGGYTDLKPLVAAGIEVVRFVPPFRSPKRGRTNLRNHRKMVIADGAVLWCGGRNLAAEYFEGDPHRLLKRKPWIDLSFDMIGEIAVQAQQQFEFDWAFATERVPTERAEAVAPVPQRGAMAQFVASGPDRVDDTIATLLISACFTSQRRILLVTPYFVPDPTLQTALVLAARRGIAVDLVVPAHSNHRLADYARHRLLRELVAAGGRVWRYPSMIHAKAFIIDDELALSGSANIDGRSLYLNYEMMVAFYDRRAVRRFAQWVEARREASRRYVARRPGMLRNLAEGLILWLAFQL